MQREIKRKTQLYGVVAVLLAVILGAICYSFGVEFQSLTQPFTEQTLLQPFSSYEELKNFLITNLRTPYYIPYRLLIEDWGLGIPFTGEFARTGTLTAYESQTYGLEYSTTNIQVEGVDEADIVKTDGEYIYVISGNNLVILEAYPPEEAEVLSKTSFNETLRELFINGDKLVVLGGSTYYSYGTFTYIDQKAFVRIYDVSDRSNPVLTRNFTISGNYFNSRMIGEYAYIVINQPAYLIYDTVVLPKIYSEDGVREISPSQIYYSNVSDFSYAFTTIVAINTQNDEQEPTQKTFLLGATSCIYVSLNNIYLTFLKRLEKTLIYRIHIENDEIECEADGEVPGDVLNQFSMDEYGGYFRIGTTTWMNATSQNNIYTLDMNLSVVGELENLAPGETIYSARFMGDRCYLVTFRQVDPFFVIDLKDPSNPKVLGLLKIPGFSRYLHPYDENHVIGIGKEGSKVKISLFDVSNVSDPQEIDKYIVGVGDERSDSAVLDDHKALLFDKPKKLLVMPVSIARWTKHSSWHGAYVFNITLNEGIVIKGNVTHLENGTEPWETGYWVKRSLYIDDVLYTISDKKIKMNSLENLELMKEVPLS